MPKIPSPDGQAADDAKALARIEWLIDLRDALWEARPPPTQSVLPTRVEEMEARAWHAVLDAARDLIASVDAHPGRTLPPTERVLH
ncbi:hypothetical protein [Roseicella sp. DB1501]|uniref:hypothetical protein n=1 Tax=Roseicella sp. DB1501 TaxID=2730925 RepID=UPI00149218EE|nr:hypothetical protein [Roseicella sp. DB1501]NOG74229.1 hypothetical protein [Roseicella sp. DB1501]